MIAVNGKEDPEDPVQESFLRNPAHYASELHAIAYHLQTCHNSQVRAAESLSVLA